MKKKSIISMVAALALVGAIGVGSTLAYFTDSDAALNIVTMGHVKIDLTEKSGEEITTDKGLVFKNIVPGDVLLKNPIITVVKDSEACYLRAKIEVSGLKEIKVGDETKDYTGALLDNINIGTDWVLNEDDGYYYYQNKIEKNRDEDQPVSLFTTVTIPTTWGNEVADTTFNIAITAEAIQADNFKPATTTVDNKEVITGWTATDGSYITVENYDEVIGIPVTTPDAE